MPIDYTIPLSGKPVQFESPVNALTQIVQLEQLKHARQMNELRARQEQRDIDQENALREFLPKLNSENRQNLLGFGERGRHTYESVIKGEKESRESDRAAAELAAKRLENARNILPSVNENTWADWRNKTIKELPGLNEFIPEQYSEAAKNKLLLDADKQIAALKPHFIEQDTGATKRVLSIPSGGGRANIVEGSEVRVTPSPNASRTNVYNNIALSTEKKFGEQFANKVADKDVLLMESAERAPELAENANRIKQLAESGKVFTGTGAGAKLQVAKILKLGGVSESEKIANTEALISSMAQQTLGSIKSSGLGSGNGFTDRDREFLSRASGGDISMDAKSIARLADLSHRTASLTANKWNKRVKQIPGSALSGTGVSQEPVEVPNARSAKPSYSGSGGLTPDELRELEQLRRSHKK